jgi:hypothetical protein
MLGQRWGMARFRLLLVVGLGIAAGAASAAFDAEPLIREVASAPPAQRATALQALERRGELDVVAPLIDLLLFLPPGLGSPAPTLERLTGQSFGGDWQAWMLWQEAHPQIEPFAGYDALKADWRKAHQDTWVLALETGHQRD